MIAFDHFKIYKCDYPPVVSNFRIPGNTGADLVFKIKDDNPLVRTLLMTAFKIDLIIRGICEE